MTNGAKRKLRMLGKRSPILKLLYVLYCTKARVLTK